MLVLQKWFLSLLKVFATSVCTERCWMYRHVQRAFGWKIPQWSLTIRSRSSWSSSSTPLFYFSSKNRGVESEKGGGGICLVPFFIDCDHLIELLRESSGKRYVDGSNHLHNIGLDDIDRRWKKRRSNVVSFFRKLEWWFSTPQKGGWCLA